MTRSIKIIFALLLLTTCDKKEVLEIAPSEFFQLSTTQQYKSLANVDENLLSLDIYYRSDTDLKKPVVIYVHGGAWAVGDKANSLNNKVNLFESLNYVFVSTNYRLSPSSPTASTPDRIKYPIHNMDVADAIKWVIENIDEYGGDPNNIVLLGHSAGAHLVALTGTNKTFMEQAGYSLQNIKGVASIDTEGYNIREQILDGNQIYINAFGTDEQENMDASPIFNISSDKVYPKFFVAKRGSLKRIQSVDKFIQKLEENDIETFQVNGSVYDHSGINEAIGAPNEMIITPALIDFFETCFR